MLRVHHINYHPFHVSWVPPITNDGNTIPKFDAYPRVMARTTDNLWSLFFERHAYVHRPRWPKYIRLP